MKGFQKALLRGIIGFPIGVTIGYAITIFASLAVGGGNYSPVVPAMADMCGSEIAAVMLQFILCGIMGMVFAAMSVAWESERLNLAAQSALHFVVSVSTMIPIAYVCFWMEHSWGGVLSYIGVFMGIYASMWVVMYLIYRSHVNQINKKIQE